MQERQSLIAGAGLGCFVTEDVKAGQFLEEYTGEIVARQGKDFSSKCCRSWKHFSSAGLCRTKGGQWLSTAILSRLPNVCFLADCHTLIVYHGVWLMKSRCQSSWYFSKWKGQLPNMKELAAKVSMLVVLYCSLVCLFLCSSITFWTLTVPSEAAR